MKQQKGDSETSASHSVGKLPGGIAATPEGGIAKDSSDRTQ